MRLRLAAPSLGHRLLAVALLVLPIALAACNQNGGATY
jgi:hypothetical protein